LATGGAFGWAAGNAGSGTRFLNKPKAIKSLKS
jgi:hypothetical protein